MAGDPNLTRYVHNTTIMRVDPSGQEGEVFQGPIVHVTNPDGSISYFVRGKQVYRMESGGYTDQSLKLLQDQYADEVEAQKRLREIAGYLPVGGPWFVKYPAKIGQQIAKWDKTKAALEKWKEFLKNLEPPTKDWNENPYPIGP